MPRQKTAPDSSPEVRALALTQAVKIMGEAAKQHGPHEAPTLTLAIAKQFEDYLK
jgi:hypothetical protein